MPSSALRQIVALAKASGVFRPRDLDQRQIARQYLRIAEQQGLIVRVGRGLYSSPDVAATEFHSFAEAAKRTPRGVICLLSALRFYDLTTQNPFEVWLAIGEKDRRPKTSHPPFRIVRFSQAALTFGRATHVIEGVSVPCLLDCQNRRRLLQIPQQDRPRCGFGSAPGISSSTKGYDHRDPEGGRGMPRRQCHAALPRGARLKSPKNVAASIRRSRFEKMGHKLPKPVAFGV
jgi:hypothetical protein